MAFARCETRSASTATALGDNTPEATPVETGVSSACCDQALCYCRKSCNDSVPGATGAADPSTFIEGAAPNRPEPALRLWSGEEGPYPPGGITPGPVPVLAVGPGPVRCAEAGIAAASAAITAAVLRSFFISLVL